MDQFNQYFGMSCQGFEILRSSHDEREDLIENFRVMGLPFWDQIT